MQTIGKDTNIIKKKYLNYIKSQEALSEPFRDKIKQFNNFFIPISSRIQKIYQKNKKTKVIGLTGGQGSGNLQFQIF